MWGIHAIPGSTHCIITEGETDAIAAMDAILHSGMPEKEFPAIVSINGVKSFNPERAEYFRGKHVLLAFDADEAGEEGKAKATSLLAGIIMTASLNWSSAEACLAFHPSQSTPDALFVRAPTPS